MTTIAKLNRPSRRALLKSGGALVVSIGAPMPLNLARAAEEARLVGAQPPLTPDQLSSYIAVNADGTISVFSGKTDLGQGLEVALAQMVAEELDVPFNAVKVATGDTGSSVNQGGASSASGIAEGGKQLRAAAAEARRVLVELAGEKLGVPGEQLSVDGGVVHSDTEKARSVSYAELVGGRYFNVTLAWNGKIGNPLYAPGKAKPKDPKDFKLVGQPIKRQDIAPKVFARQDFCTDIKVPGMVHGRMIRPAVAGAVPVNVDESSIKEIPGARVVWNQGFLGVVADKEWDAIKAARELKVTWSNPAPPFPDRPRSTITSAKRQCARAKPRASQSAMLTRRLRTQCASSKPNTNGPSSPMPAWDPLAPSSISKAIRSRSGPVRKSRISPAMASPKSSVCRPTRCAVSGLWAQALTAATTPAIVQWTPPCWPKRSAGRCAYNICAIRPPAGIRRRRPRSIAPALRSTRPAR